MPLEASVILKISASNPSRFSEREVSVKSFLPKGIRPENVIDAGGLEIGYDVKRGQCYVYKDLTLDAQSSVSFDVEIDDIWLISEETLEDLSDKAGALVEKLEETEYDKVSSELKEEIEAYLTNIRKKQEDSLVYRVGPTEHISAYEANLETVGLIESNIEGLEQLLLDTEQGTSGRRGAKRSSRAQQMKVDEARERILRVNRDGGNSCLVDFALKEEQKEVIFDSPKIVSFGVAVENPSTVDPRTVPVKYLLAKEIKARDVVDSDELKIGFDFERGLYYVFDDAVELEPGEQKVFEVVLNNQWIIDKRDLYSKKIYIESMMRAGEQARGLDSVKKIGTEALDKTYELLQRQDMVELTERNVAIFRKDEEKKESVELDVQKMAGTLMQAGISPEISLVEQEEICKKTKRLGLSDEDMVQELGAVGVLESEKIKLMAGTIFKGKSISSVSTWSLIGYIVLFLGIISSVFYFVNIRQRESKMFDALTGAFSREYVLERFREELKIAKGGDKKCSILIMDIDKFKNINDTYGHAAGDTILREFVIAIRKGVRATDIVGRFGGDEFIIILPTNEKAMSLKIAGNIARIVEGTVIRVSPQVTLGVTTSIGVATFPEDSGTAEDLFDKADKALYEVKKRGGNGFEAFGGNV